LVGESIFAVRDVLFGGGPIRRTQLCVGHAQVLLKPGYRILVPMILLKTSTLVEDVGRVLGIDEQVREDGDAFVEVATQARLSGGALLRLLTGLLARRESGRSRKR
jgi:hypothetical protein